MLILLAKISPPQAYGGAEQAANDIALSLKGLGHDAVVLTNSRNISEKCALDGVECKLLPFSSIGSVWLFKLVTPVYWILCGLAARKLKPHCIISNSQQDHIGFSITKSMHKTPIICQDHGDLIHTIRSSRKNPVGKLIQSLLIHSLKTSDRIAFLNKQDLNSFADVLARIGVSIDNSKLLVIRSSIVFDRYTVDSGNIEEKGDKTIVGYIGRLDETKGAHFINDISEFLATQKGVEFWVVGSGVFDDRLIRRRGTRFWGYRKDISPLLSAIDILIQPSINEGWGRTVEEAMYFEKAVAASNVGGLSEQIKHNYNGLLFEPGNVKDMSECLNKLIKNPMLRNRLARNAKKTAIDRGDYKVVVEKTYLPLIKQLVS